MVMNTTSVTRSVVVGTALVGIGLGAATVASVQRAHKLETRLEQTQAALDKLKSPSATRSGAGFSEESLLKLIEDKEAAYAELSEENQQLRKQLAERASTARAGAQASSAGSGGPATGWAGGRAWLDRIREEDPERYKQIVAQREERRKAADQWLKDQLTQLDHRAQTAMTQEESELASQIADSLAKLDDLRSQWAAIRDLPDDQREAAAQQLRADMRATFQQLGELRDRDRNMQFASLVQSLGVTDQNTVQNSVDTINSTLDSTRYRPPGGMGGGPGGPGGWFGDGGRRGDGASQQQRQQAQQTTPQ